MAQTLIAINRLCLAEFQKSSQTLRHIAIIHNLLICFHSVITDKVEVEIDLTYFVFSILSILESGVVQKWQRDHWKQGENKCDKSQSSIGHSATDLLNTAGAYIALAAGLAMAVTVLLLELLVKYIHKVHWTKVKNFFKISKSFNKI